MRLLGIGWDCSVVKIDVDLSANSRKSKNGIKDAENIKNSSEAVREIRISFQAEKWKEY